MRRCLTYILGFFILFVLHDSRNLIFAKEADNLNNAENLSPSAHQQLHFAADSLYALRSMPAIRYDKNKHPPVLPAFKPAVSERRVNKTRLAFSGCALVGANYYAYKRFENMWWNHPKSSFHFYRGWRQTEGWYDFGPDDSLWHHMDKFGHYYNARLLSLLLSDIALWIGFEENPAQWIGAVSSWLLYLQIELFDAQFEQWGFSLGDLAANTAGAFMPIWSSRSSLIQNFTLKWSYAPAQLEQQKYMVEDYAGMTFWLTTNPQHLLPDFFDDFWPDFLNLALGYSITQKAYGEIELYIGLDYDLTKIQTNSLFWNRVLYYLNFIHLPAPAIKIRPVTDYYLFCY